MTGARPKCLTGRAGEARHLEPDPMLSNRASFASPAPIEFEISITGKLRCDLAVLEPWPLLSPAGDLSRQVGQLAERTAGIRGGREGGNADTCPADLAILIYWASRCTKSAEGRMSFYRVRQEHGCPGLAGVGHRREPATGSAGMPCTEYATGRPVIKGQTTPRYARQRSTQGRPEDRSGSTAPSVPPVPPGPQAA